VGIEPAQTALDSDGVLKRVLIADDNGYVRTVIRTVLQDQDEIQVCGEAANGAEAIEKTRQLKPDGMSHLVDSINGVFATHWNRKKSKNCKNFFGKSLSGPTSLINRL
jgi:DNA-binding NarL/FixJ family response regulator